MNIIERSDEVIMQLNRIVNDRNVDLRTRNKIRDAARHIEELHAAVQNIEELNFRLEKRSAVG